MHSLLRPRAMQFIWDVAAVTLTVFVFLAVREIIDPEFPRFQIEQKIVISILVVLYWASLFWLGGLYRDYYVRSPFEEFFAILKQTFFGTAILFFLILFDSSIRNQPRPRFTIVVFWVVLIVAVSLSRIIARRLQRSLRERRVVTIPAVLLGTPARLIELLHSLRLEPAWGYDVQGVVTVGSHDIAALSNHASILS